MDNYRIKKSRGWEYKKNGLQQRREFEVWLMFNSDTVKSR